MRSVALPIWQELLVGLEMFYLRVSPVYWGVGLPKGDGSAVVVVPGFLGTDWYTHEFRAWLRRIGYESCYSGIGWNAECPNLLIRLHLRKTIQDAYKSTGRKVHLIGHSLGGIIARAVALQMPDRIASVISLGSPFRGIAAHPSICRASEFVRQSILARHQEQVLPDCYTAKCTCDFLGALHTDLPKSMPQTAVYTKADGIVDWQVCMTGDPDIDCEVSSTHIGLVFSPLVYSLVATRLAAARRSNPEVRNGRRNQSRTRTTAGYAGAPAGPSPDHGGKGRRRPVNARKSGR